MFFSLHPVFFPGDFLVCELELFPDRAARWNVARRSDIQEAKLYLYPIRVSSWA